HVVDHVGGPEGVGVVHVEGVGGRAAVVGDARGDQHVAAVVGAQAAQPFGHAEPEKTHFVQVFVVVGGEAGLAVVLEGALGPGNAVVVHLGDQLSLLVGKRGAFEQRAVVGRTGVLMEVAAVHEGLFLNVHD